MTGTPVVLLTDRAWPDDSIERGVVEAAGFVLVAGPAEPAPPDLIESLIREHEPAAVLTCWAPVSARAIRSTANLRIVARMGVGLDNIDVAAATESGVLVTNVPDYCIDEVSDHALAMVLAWTRGIVVFDRAVRGGGWEPAAARLRRLSSLTCGIVGYGRIGRQTARKLRAFGCRILVSDPVPRDDAQDVTFVDLDTLLCAANVVILHAPLTPQTQGLIGVDQLARMQPGGLLVNVSRGGLVDTAAVTDALARGYLSGAAFDVLDTEPEVPASLLEHSGVVVTPHIGFSSDVSLADLRRGAAEEVVRVLLGEPSRHPCNTPGASGTDARKEVTT